jgi:hypothetical protein
MKEVVLVKTFKVTRQPALELGRTDIETALREYVEKRGYKADSLFHFEYENGSLIQAVVEIEK